MSDTFPRTVGDPSPSPVGYRPLPGTGTTSGPELSTIVFATIGVALGIVVGTVCADGSWRSLVPGSSHQAVLASTTVVRPAPDSTQIASATPPPKRVDDRTMAQKDLDEHPLPQRTLPPVASSGGSGMLIVTAPVETLSARTVPPQPRPVNSNPIQSSPVQSSLIPSGPVRSTLAQASPAQPASAQSRPQPHRQPVAMHELLTAQTTPLPIAPGQVQRLVSHSSLDSGTAQTRPVSLARSRRAARRLAARNRRIAWRKAHPRHKLPAYLRAGLYHPHVPVADAAPKPEVEYDAAPARFAFSVEGYTTVFSYDSQAGTIQTYEGSVFILNNPASLGSNPSWLDGPANLHCSCDQDWNCTLAHAGVEVATARRAR